MTDGRSVDGIHRAVQWLRLTGGVRKKIRRRMNEYVGQAGVAAPLARREQRWIHGRQHHQHRYWTSETSAGEQQVPRTTHHDTPGHWDHPPYSIQHMTTSQDNHVTIKRRPTLTVNRQPHGCVFIRYSSGSVPAQPWKQKLRPLSLRVLAHPNDRNCSWTVDILIFIMYTYFYIAYANISAFYV